MTRAKGATKGSIEHEAKHRYRADADEKKGHCQTIDSEILGLLIILTPPHAKRRTIDHGIDIEQ
jgi:hypothetical protein